MDTETPDTDTTVTVTKRERAAIDVAAGTVTLAGVAYATADLPPTVAQWLELRGLASRLQLADDAGAEFAKLKAGTIPSHGPAKAKELDPWRKAYAHAYAEKQAKEAGVKPKAPEFAAMLDEAMQRAAALDKAGLKQIKYNPAVVAHYARITGADTAL